MPVGRGHEETLKLKQRKRTEKSFDFVIFIMLAIATEDRTFTMPQSALCLVLDYSIFVLTLFRMYWQRYDRLGPNLNSPDNVLHFRISYIT